MKINSAQNTSFGQIYVSGTTIEKIKKQYKRMPEETRPDKDTFMRNWNKCLKTKDFDLLIQDDEKVYLLDKTGKKVMQEELSRKFIWNIDSALKRILLFEEAVPSDTPSKYDY